MAWKLPDGKTINSPRDIIINDVQYPAQIFRQWSKAELNAIGIYPFREVRYDQKWYDSTGYSEVEIDGEIVRTHGTAEKLTNGEAKVLQIDTIKSIYISKKRRATELEDFYDAVGDNVTKNIWGTYITDLKNDAKDLKDAVNAAGTYDQIINFDFTWTTPPDATI